jgi:ATP-dependent DNA ligase
MLNFVESHGLEGIVAKHARQHLRDQAAHGTVAQTADEPKPGVRGGRIYIPGSLGVDSLVCEVYQGKDLHYVARVRAGFVPATRREVSEQLAPDYDGLSFVNLPEVEPERWGQGLTAEKTWECVWVKPLIVGEVEFLDCTGADRLRHTKSIRLRDDKDSRKVVRET